MQNKVYRAGTIPYVVEDGTVLMMFMKPSDSTYGGDKYQIAKGKIEPGEDAQSAAIREAKEEIGLFASNIELIAEVGVFMGRTTVFVTKMKNQLLFGEPSFETESVIWMTLDEFMVDGRELHRPVVSACHDKIVELEKLRA